MAIIPTAIGTSIRWFTTMLLGLTACTLVYNHVQVITSTQSSTVPSLASVQQLEQVREVLQQQTELAELQIALESDYIEEQVEAFVLPTELDTDRIVALFDAMQQYFAYHGLAAGNETELFIERSAIDPSISLVLPMHADAIAIWSQLVELSGIVTVHDALNPEHRTALLRYTEKNTPAALPDIEAFFNLSLLEYGSDADLHIRRLMRSFNDSVFTELLELAITSPHMQGASKLFSGSLGELFAQNSLWPMPFMQLNQLSLTKGSEDHWYQTRWEILFPSTP